jgi:hypothetical protein
MLEQQQREEFSKHALTSSYLVMEVNHFSFSCLSAQLGRCPGLICATGGEKEREKDDYKA